MALFMLGMRSTANPSALSIASIIQNLKSKMTNSLPNDEDSSLQISIQESLQELSQQLGHPLNREDVTKLYENARNLLSHLAPAPITLARVAGALLVYQVQQTEPEELQWFRNQIAQCRDDEEVEESIESIHRIDGL
jgi:DNA-directed RNA polymerase